MDLDPAACDPAATAPAPTPAPVAAAASTAPRLPDGGRHDRLILGLLLLGMAAWSGWFIYRSSFVASGKRVFCLFDDAMISMAYARNLVEGYGLNWAREGRPVEGFTHPLWTALMVPVNALPMDLRWRSLAVQLLSLAILALHVVLVRRLMLRHFSTGWARHWLPAAVLTACYYPLNYWALMGMESGLQALLTTASVLLALDIVWRGEDRHRELLIVGAVAYLVRMDMLVVVAAAQLYVFAGGGWRRGQRASWWQGVAAFAAVAMAYEAFRWVYFHDLLPNTYYLKLFQIPLGVRLRRGGAVLADSLLDHWLLLAAIAAGAGVALRYGAGRRELFRRLALPAGLLLAACAYSVYVGGDAWEMIAGLNVRANRFVVYAMPQLFVIFNALLNARPRRLAPGAAQAAAPGLAWRRGASVAAATVFALLAADGLLSAELEGENLAALLVRAPPFLVAMDADVYSKLINLQAALGSGCRLATSSAGVPAYFSDYRMVDLYGINERHIARLPPALPLPEDDPFELLPGHVKYDCPYVIRQYHPDAFLVPRQRGGPAPARQLVAGGYRFDREKGFWLPVRRAACGATERLVTSSGLARKVRFKR